MLCVLIVMSGWGRKRSRRVLGSGTSSVHALQLHCCETPSATSRSSQSTALLGLRLKPSLAGLHNIAKEKKNLRMQFTIENEKFYYMGCDRCACDVDVITLCSPTSVGLHSQFYPV